VAAYYNEIDGKAAAWLRELIKRGLIADGEVDERSITDVAAGDLLGFTQCHFFAGIGVWSYALRCAGWSDDMPVWTGSCPCQPFSTAGKGKGIEDERHLWPVFHNLIDACRPPVVFGEQVAGKAGLAWLDNVQSDLEGSDYSSGAVTFPACSVGAPHQRQRMYWAAENALADANEDGFGAWGEIRPFRQESDAEHGGSVDVVANSAGPRLEKRASKACPRQNAQQRPKRLCTAGSMADTNVSGRQGSRQMARPSYPEAHENRKVNRNVDAGSCDGGFPRPTNGHWGDADWIFCRDEKWRAVEPGTFPLADGPTARVGRLRGYGNAIVAPQAQVFIESYMEIT